MSFQEQVVVAVAGLTVLLTQNLAFLPISVKLINRVLAGDGGSNFLCVLPTIFLLSENGEIFIGTWLATPYSDVHAFEPKIGVTSRNAKCLCEFLLFLINQVTL